MGTVFLGLDAQNRWVAVKTLHRHLARQNDFVARFAREVDNARRVTSPYTPSVLDAETSARTPYMVTEFVDGPTLSHEIRLRGPLSRSELHQLAVNLASALLAFHRAGIIHRDIKPSNIILSRTGPRIIDLGISRAMDDHVAMTTYGAPQPGTPQLMAPEQWTSDQPSSATDVFGWAGVVAYAGTGVFPFTGTEHRPLREAVLNDRPTLVGLDHDLEPLVAQALEKHPAARPPVGALLAQLLGVGTDSFEAPVGPWTGPATPVPNPEPNPASLTTLEKTPPTAVRASDPRPRESRQRHSRRGIILASALAAVLLAGAGTLAATLQSSPQTAGKSSPQTAPRASTGAAAPTVVVPRLVGKTEREARARLAALGLVAKVKTDSRAQVTVPPGQVESQDRIGAHVATRTVVTLTVVSTRADVPDVTGSQYSSAAAQLSAAGFKVVREFQRSTRPAGTVIGQSAVGAAAAARGSTVRLLASSGPAAGTEGAAPQTVPTPQASARRTTAPTAPDPIVLPTDILGTTPPAGGQGGGQGGGGQGNSVGQGSTTPTPR